MTSPLDPELPFFRECCLPKLHCMAMMQSNSGGGHQIMDRRFSRRLVDQYLRAGHHQVHGWLNDVDASIVRAIGDIQTADGLGGSVGEIGVHHGRLFVLLYLLIHEGERAWCIDVFDDQELNIDGSGRGDRAVFLASVQTHAGDADDIEIIQASSDAVEPDQILDTAGQVRLCSIDGGHTEVLTAGDLRLMDAALSPHGVIVMDDVFHPAFPGVSNGLHTFFRNEPDLVPFAISVNKVLLCRPGLAAFYQRRLKEANSINFQKTAEFLGQPVQIYVDTKDRIGARRFRVRKVKKTLRRRARSMLRALGVTTRG